MEYLPMIENGEGFSNIINQGRKVAPENDLTHHAGLQQQQLKCWYKNIGYSKTDNLAFFRWCKPQA